MLSISHIRFTFLLTVGDTLAYYENDARRFLFPEPKLVPSYSGTEQEVLMTQGPHFPGICPRLEFSTTTTIFECADNIRTIDYPNVPMRPLMKRQRRCARPRTSSPQRRPRSLVRTRSSASGHRGVSRSRSMSPQRDSNTQRLARLSLDPEHPGPASSPQLGLSTRPGARSASPIRSSTLTSSTVSRSPLTVRFASPDENQAVANGQDPEATNGDINLSYLQDSLQSTDLSPLRLSSASSRRSGSSSHRMWEEVQQRVRGLLTTPKAVRRLAYVSSCHDNHEQ
uniref:Spermatogenesis associated 6-like n=1 Tax=Neogobius melanostomus TaxID=47308 RepID=A0A8C6T462_9GOBI